METKPSTISRAAVLNGQVSLAVLDTTALVQEAQRRHGLKEASLRVLGKTLTAACYLGGWLKGAKSSLTVSVSSDGDFGRISVLSDGNLNLRGYVENKDCVKGRLGKGTLTIVRDDREGLPFAGTVPLVSEETEENFSAYFRESEQLQTGIALSVVLDGEKVVRAGGVFLQALPFASEEARAFIKNGAARFQKFLDAGEYRKILEEFGVEKAESREARFACSCSYERVESLILSMGAESALSLCEEEGSISVHCEYCNTDYSFGKERVRKLFKKHDE